MKKYSYIDEIIGLFQSSYYELHGMEYVIMNIGKERNMAGKLLRHYKEYNPNKTSEETLNDLKKYFNRCVSINDTWLRQNMSLSIIISKFNEINNILRNGKQNSKGGATKSDLIKIFSKDIQREG